MIVRQTLRPESAHANTAPLTEIRKCVLAVSRLIYISMKVGHSLVLFSTVVSVQRNATGHGYRSPLADSFVAITRC